MHLKRAIEALEISLEIVYDKTKKNHQTNNESIPSKPQQTNYRQSSPTTVTNVTTNHNRNIKQSF